MPENKNNDNNHTLHRQFNLHQLYSTGKLITYMQKLSYTKDNLKFKLSNHKIFNDLFHQTGQHKNNFTF